MIRITIDVPQDWDGYLGGNPYPKAYTFTAKSNPCDNCPNNPANNPLASGICNCALPYMNQVVY